MTQNDISTLARTLWGEARGEGIDGMTAVACVILNRVKHPGWWGRDASTVCTAKYQFSCWLAGDPNRDKLLAVTIADPQYSQAVIIATAALGGHITDITSGADSYFAAGSPVPKWAVGKKPCAVIGHHQFYRLEA
jgi:N-acetylmuramoyl-L-alanine amidase